MSSIKKKKNGVNHKIRGYGIQKRVSRGKETSEGKCLNDGCVLGLEYNSFQTGVTGWGCYRQWYIRRKTECYVMCFKVGKN